MPLRVFATAVLMLVCAVLVVTLGRNVSAGSAIETQGSRGARIEFDARATAEQPAITKRALGRTIRLMRERATQLGTRDAQIRRLGATRVTVTLPNVHDAARAARQLGARGQLYLFDWEASVLDAECRTNPQLLNGGQREIEGLRRAVVRASRCTAERDENNTAAGAIYYAFDRRSKRPLNDGVPEETRAGLLRALARDGSARRPEIVSVPEGVIVSRAPDLRAPDARQGSLDHWWVLRDEPALDGGDIRNPKQAFEDEGSPVVEMGFTAHGQRALVTLTAEIARRGAEHAGGAGDSTETSQHFAIRLDRDVLVVPFVDYRKNPTGIDSKRGIQISGGFTIREARDLAELLAGPALPLRMHVLASSALPAKRR